MSAERDEDARSEDRANEKEHRPFVHSLMIPVPEPSLKMTLTSPSFATSLAFETM